jgi:hypothetical protein
MPGAIPGTMLVRIEATVMGELHGKYDHVGVRTVRMEEGR